MRYLINESGRIIGQTADPLHTSAISAVLPVDANIYDYVYVDNAFIYSPEIFERINISIDPISNTEPDFDDGDNEYTVIEQTEYIATGEIAIPDQNFRVPFQRTDTGTVRYMKAVIKDGAFTLFLKFPTGGEWLVNTDLINSELPTHMFSIAEHKFKVI